MDGDGAKLRNDGRGSVNPSLCVLRIEMPVKVTGESAFKGNLVDTSPASWPKKPLVT